MLGLLKSSEPPDAVFCASDILGMGALRAAREFGVKVPQQIAILGFDDLDVLAYIGLTTIRQHLEESGRLAVESASFASRKSHAPGSKNSIESRSDRTLDVPDASVSKGGAQSQQPNTNSHIEPNRKISRRSKNETFNNFGGSDRRFGNPCPCGTPATPAPTQAPPAAQPTAVPAQPTAAPAQPTAAPAQPTSAPAAGADNTAGANEANARAAGLTFLADAYAGKYKGKTVTMTGPQVAEDEVKMQQQLQSVHRATGINVAVHRLERF